jgi:hypothetical protein
VRVAVAVSWTVIHAWQVDDLPVSHPSFSDDMVSEILHVFTGSLQNRDLHAAFVVQVDVQRGPREIMMIMKILCEALRQFTLVMVVDVNKSRETLLPPRGLHRMLLKPGSR